MRTFWQLWLGISALVFAMPAQAQTTASDSVYHLPSVFVTDLVADVKTANDTTVITGAFNVENQEAAIIGDLHYQIQVLGARSEAAPGTLVADNALEYDRIIDSKTLTLLPGEQRGVPFTYTPPRLPGGDYRLRLRMITSEARALGWKDLSITLDQPDGPFVFLQADRIELADGTKFTPNEGPNVAPGASLTLQAVAENQQAQAVTATPYLELYRWDITGEKVASQSLPPLTVEAKASARLDVPLSAPLIPDAYHAVVTLRDGEGKRLSSQAVYRFVVTGTSAKVVSAQFDQLATRQGQLLTITTGVVGPADRQTALPGTAAVALLDGAAVVGQQEIAVSLSAGLQTIKTGFTLPRDITAPAIRVTLKDTQGKILDTYEVAPTLSAYQLATANTAAQMKALQRKILLLALAAVGGLLLLLIGLIVFLALRRRWHRPLATGAALLILFAASVAHANGIHVSSSLGVFSSTVQREGDVIYLNGVPVVAYIGGNYIYLETGSPIISLFINQPVHNGTYTQGVPIEFDVNFLGCVNKISIADITINHQNSNDFLNGNLTAPTTDAAYTWSGYFCPPGTPHACPYAVNGVYGKLNNFGDLAKTTLQFHGDWYQNSRSDPAHADTTWNLWVFLKDSRLTPSPSPTVVPSGSPGTTPTFVCADAVDNDGDSRIDSNDPACHPSDHNENNPASYVPSHFTEVDPQCSDRKDNDGDSLIDIADPGCHTDGNVTNAASYDPKDDNEADPVCSDGKDNDSDGRTDAADPTCHPSDHKAENSASYQPQHTSEVDVECSDAQDNLDPEDSLADISDPGCHSDRNASNAASYNPADESEIDSAPDAIEEIREID